MIVDPLVDGAVQDNDTFPVFAVAALNEIGAPGAAAGVTAVVATAVPLPAAVTARTRK